MGILNAIPYAGYQSPWASLRQRYGQHEGEHGAGGDMPKGPMPPAPSNAPPSFWDRLNTGFQGLESNPMFTMGLSLLGNAQNGGDWSGVLEDMQGMGDRRRQQQILDNEMRRQKTGDAREETRYGRENTQYQAFEAAVNAETDPNRRQELLALGPEGFAQRRNAELQMAWQERQAEANRAFEERQGALNRAAMMARARPDPRDAIGYRIDMNRLAESANSAGAAHNLRQLLVDQRDLLNELAQLNGVRQAIESGDRVLISRLIQSNPQAAGIMERIRENQTRLTLIDAQAIRPVSNVDLENLQRIQPNADRELVGSMGSIDAAIARIDADLAHYGEQVRWLDQYNGLTGTTNERGQSFEEYWADRQRGERGNSSGGNNRPRGNIRGGNSAPRPPAVGTVRNGFRYRGGDPSLPSSWERIQR